MLLSILFLSPSDFKVCIGLKKEFNLLSKDILLLVFICILLLMKEFVAFFIFFAVSIIIFLSNSFSLKVDNFGRLSFEIEVLI